MTIRDRIKDFRRVPARELLDNDGNPRTHPQAQRDALRGLLEQVVVAGALAAYSSDRNGGRITLIDDQLPKQDCDLNWPTLVLDVTTLRPICCWSATILNGKRREVPRLLATSLSAEKPDLPDH